MLAGVFMPMPMLAVDYPLRIHVIAVVMSAWCLLWAVIFERRHRRGQ